MQMLKCAQRVERNSHMEQLLKLSNLMAIKKLAIRTENIRIHMLNLYLITFYHSSIVFNICFGNTVLQIPLITVFDGASLLIYYSFYRLPNNEKQ